MRSDPAPGPAGQEHGRRWWVPAGILAVVALLVGAVLWVDGRGTETPTSGRATGTAAPAPVTGAPGQPGGVVAPPTAVAVPDLSAQEARDPADLLAEGPVDAPVVMVMFTDYQCGFCARWTEETLPAMREYVERGELRIEYRDVNIYGEDSERAARASLAAAMQGAHAEYQAALFEGGEIRSSSELTEEALISLAGELGLDPERFAADMASEPVRTTIAEHARQGAELGAVATPAFVIGGRPTVGAQPTEVFQGLVEDALAESAGAGADGDVSGS